MRTRDIVRYAKKIVKQDIETIGANRAELMRGTQRLPDLRKEIKGLPFDNPGSFRMLPWGPRPTSLLLDIAFREMRRSQSEKPPAGELIFAGDVLVPLAGIGAKDATHEGTWSSEDAAGCGMAELRFLSALQQVRSLRNMGQNQVSTYHDETGTPVLFRKSNGESTALNLTPIALGGSLVLPAGTILSVDKDMGGEQTGEYRGDRFNLATYALPQVLEVSPVRLSPWSYDNPADRAIFGLPQGKAGDLREDCERNTKGYIEHTALGDFTEASQRIAELCFEPNP